MCMSESFFFYLFAGITVATVGLMIFQTNPIASVLYLVFGFFGIAGLYVLLSAPFLAVLQVLVYAGAIMVLFIFVLMLLKLRQEDLIYDRMTWRNLLVVLMALGSAGFLIFRFMKLDFHAFPPIPPGSGVAQLEVPQFGEADGVGRLLFTHYLIPFEITSILLLVAIIGAVMLGKKEKS